jgi:hypothetical protein
MAFEISLGVVAVTSRNNRRNSDCGVFEFPVTPLAAGSECESRFPKILEEVADFPWHMRNHTLLG